MRLQHTFLLLDIFFTHVGKSYLTLLPSLQSQTTPFSLAHLDSSLVGLILNHLTPIHDSWAITPQRLQWGMTLTHTSPSIKALILLHFNPDTNTALDLNDRELCDQWLAHWRKLNSYLFLARVIRDIAVPVSMSTGQCLSFATLIQTNQDFTRASTLAQILAFLQEGIRKSGDVSRKGVLIPRFSQLLDIFISEFCIENSKKIDQIELSLVEELLKIVTDRHPMFQTLAPTYPNNLAPSQHQHQQNQSVSTPTPQSTPSPTKGGRGSSSSSKGKDKAKGKKQIVNSNSPNVEGRQHLVASASLRRYILRMFLTYTPQINSPTSHTQFTQFVKNKLLDMLNSDPESPPCLLYISAHSTILHDTQPSPEEIVQTITLSDVLGTNNNNNDMVTRLEAVAKARYFLEHLAKEVIHSHQTNTPLSNGMVLGAERLLSVNESESTKKGKGTSKDKEGPFVHPCANLRGYFLKEIARSHGLNFAQEVVARASSGDKQQMEWVKEWVEDVRMKRFMRKRHLLSVDPFGMERKYHSVRDIVRAAVEGDTKPLFTLLTPKEKQSSSPSPPVANVNEFKTHLIAAIFQEVYVMYTVDNSPKEALRFCDWFKSLNAPLLTPFDHAFALALASNTFIEDENPNPENNNNNATSSTQQPTNFFKLSPTSTSEHLVLISVLFHVAATILGHSRPESVFAKLLLNPVVFTPPPPIVSTPTAVASTPVVPPSAPSLSIPYVPPYVPTMPDDQRLQFMNLLGGGWYECPNGHTYHVDRCGRPMEKFNCPSCGMAIGGLDHELEPTNKESNKEDATIPGYLITQPTPDNTHSGDRNLSPLAFRILRIIIHGLMLVGCAVDKPVREEVKRVLSGRTGSSIPPTHYLTEHVLNDWNVIKELTGVSAEDVAIALHLIAHDIGEKPQVDGTVAILLNSKDGRLQWERQFETTCISPFVGSNLSASLQTYFREFGGDDGVVGEIRETLDIVRMPVATRSVLLPTLWRHTIPIPSKFEQLKMHFIQSPENKERYPILFLFLTEEEQIRSLRYLKSALDWQRLLCVRFDRRIDREYARTHTIGEILDLIAEGERRSWTDAFDGYIEAWNAAWKFVDRFVCMEIPPLFRSLTMTPSTPLCFSLPTERDEGICPLALVRYLVDKHNQFLNKVHEILKSRVEAIEPETAENAAKGKSKHPTKGKNHTEEYTVPTHLLKEADLIVYSGSDHSDVISFLQLQVEQPLHYPSGTTLSFHYDRIEQHLIDEVLIGKPLIDMEVRTFDYSNETRLTGALVHLRQRIPQLELPGDAKQAILKDLGGLGRIRSTMHVLEICIGFLAATGGTLVQQLPGEIWLSDYVRNTLLLTDCDDISGPTSAIGKYTQLQHVVSLWTLLDENLNVDQFKDVLPKYKKPLPPPFASTIQLSMSNLQLPLLLPTFKDMILTALNEGGGNLGENIPIKEALSYCEVSITENLGSVQLGELRWFENFFPENIPMKYCLEAYKLLAGDN